MRAKPQSESSLPVPAVSSKPRLCRLLVLGLTALGLSMPAACRRGAEPSNGDRKRPAETVPQPSATTANAGLPALASAPPAAKPVLDIPPDPGGCFAGDCHHDLLRVAYRHGPIQEGACDACHDAEQPDHKFPLKRSGREGCTNCHPVVGQKAYVHAVVDQQGCLVCHDPHGSNTRFLLTAASTELTCRQCHEMERKTYLHGPFAGGQCTACHEPHESDNRFLLLGGEGGKHCLLCHEKTKAQLVVASAVHEPVEAGECTTCHDAHTSEYPGVLKAPVEVVCFQCHPDVKEEMSGAGSIHGAVWMGRRCSNCHDPHAQGRPYLLQDDMPGLCLSCHDRAQTATDGRIIPDMRPVLQDRKTLHGPVRDGDCGACHNAHGSQNARLLRTPFASDFYLPFALSHYKLCFECHDETLVLEERTTTLTGFRDGDRNLHYLHVNRPEKGRTCRTCHEIHGSDLPMHLASAVPFEGSRWAMPIRFEKTTAGGRCSPGCHGPQEYRRTLAPDDVPARDVPETGGEP